MCRLPSKTRFRRATFGLALALLVWVGGLVPLEAVSCPHGSSRIGLAHDAGLCAWSCASHQQEATAVGLPCGTIHPNGSWGEQRRWPAALRRQAPVVLLRGPPELTVAAQRDAE